MDGGQDQGSTRQWQTRPGHLSLRSILNPFLSSSLGHYVAYDTALQNSVQLLKRHRGSFEMTTGVMLGKSKLSKSSVTRCGGSAVTEGRRIRQSNSTLSNRTTVREINNL